MKYELDSMNNLPTAPSYFTVKSESAVMGDHLHLCRLTYQRILENVSSDVFVQAFVATTLNTSPAEILYRVGFAGRDVTRHLITGIGL